MKHCTPIRRTSGEIWTWKRLSRQSRTSLQDLRRNTRKASSTSINSSIFSWIAQRVTPSQARVVWGREAGFGSKVQHSSRKCNPPPTYKASSETTCECVSSPITTQRSDRSATHSAVSWTATTSDCDSLSWTDKPCFRREWAWLVCFRSPV